MAEAHCSIVRFFRTGRLLASKKDGDYKGNNMTNASGH